jgi:hypothetical protein
MYVSPTTGGLLNVSNQKGLGLGNTYGVQETGIITILKLI